MNRMNFFAIALCLFAASAVAQAPGSVDQTPAATSVPLIQIKLGFDPKADPRSRYSVIRPEVPAQSPLLRSLGWMFLFKGRQTKSIVARDSTTAPVTTPLSGKYSVFLTAYVNGRAERVSNLIEVDVDLEKSSKPEMPAGAVLVNPKAGASSAYKSLESKDLLKLDLKKVDNRHIITRPDLPAGAGWSNLAWVVILDGRESQSVAAHDNPTFEPHIAQKGSYEVHLRALVDRRNVDVSERVKFRVVR